MNSYISNPKTQRNIMIGGGVLLVIIVVLMFAMTRSKKETTDTVAKSVLRNTTTPTDSSLQIVVKDSNDDLSAKPLNFFLPKGIILAWNGTASDIPTGWALCDGNNGTPDLRHRFIFGYHPNDSNSEVVLKKTGGSWDVTLNIEQIPQHNHFTEFAYGSGGTELGTSNWETKNKVGTRNNTSLTGGGQPHPNMPPYMVLCHIMKL